MGDTDQAALQTASSQKVTLVGLDGVDVPCIRRRRAPHGVLKSTSPICSIQSVIVYDEHLEPLIGVTLCCHFSLQNRHIIVVLSQGQTLLGFYEVITGNQPGQRDAVHPKRPVRSNALRCGGLACGHAVCAIGKDLRSKVLVHRTGVHHRQRSTRVCVQGVKTCDSVIYWRIRGEVTCRIAFDPAISTGI